LLQRVRGYLALRSQGRDPGPLLEAAWNQFYGAQAPRLIRLARQYSRLGADPEDGAQAIWEKIVARLPRCHTLAQHRSIDAWLTALARHALVDQSRSDHTRPTADPQAKEVDRLPGTGPGPEAVCELHQAQQFVHRALAELRTQVSETSYQVLRQHWIEGRSFAAIAHDLGLTTKQVRDRHGRVLRRLRHVMTLHAEGRLLRE
jgi:RNA polymerase sigma factor (sigma-70 family)